MSRPNCARRITTSHTPHWPRTDPAVLKAFDPSTKVCHMNCGPHRDDPRSDIERLYQCTDCPATTRSSVMPHPMQASILAALDAQAEERQRRIREANDAHWKRVEELAPEHFAQWVESLGHAPIDRETAAAILKAGLEPRLGKEFSAWRGSNYRDLFKQN